MKEIRRILFFVLTTLILIGAAYAKFSRPDEAIAYRKSVMTIIGQHFKQMGLVVKGKTNYQEASFSADANVVKLLATLPWEAFLEPRSDKGKTNMSSSVFKKEAQFKEAAASFESATAQLAEAAQKGDLKAIKSKFGEVAQTCNSCHKKFQK